MVSVGSGRSGKSGKSGVGGCAVVCGGCDDYSWWWVKELEFGVGLSG